MIKKLFLTIISIFLLNSCSLDSILALSQINKIQKVRSTSYTKEYRGYFARKNLKPVTRGRKFIFYYNRHKKDLAVLTHPKGEYIVYSITRSPNKVLHINSSRKKGYRYTNRLLRKRGYRQITPTSVGYKTYISRRIFKGHKTYYLRAINYQKLIYRYKQAIRTYNYNKVKHIKTKLPHTFIASYFKLYQTSAKTAKEKTQIKLIGIKLNLIKDTISKQEKPSNDTKSPSMYEQYSKCTSYTKLHKFLHSKKAKESLSYAEFSRLTYKEAKLREDELLKHGSIEELIAEYKRTNNPRYKQKAMQLIKMTQK